MTPSVLTIWTNPSTLGTVKSPVLYANSMFGPTLYGISNSVYKGQVLNTEWTLGNPH